MAMEPQAVGRGLCRQELMTEVQEQLRGLQVGLVWGQLSYQGQVLALVLALVLAQVPALVLALGLGLAWVLVLEPLLVLVLVLVLAQGLVMLLRE